MNHAVREIIRCLTKRIRSSAPPIPPKVPAMITSAYSEYRQTIATIRHSSTIESDGCFRVQGMSLKLEYRMVLVISAPSPAASRNQAPDQCQLCNGSLNP